MTITQIDKAKYQCINFLDDYNIEVETPVPYTISVENLGNDLGEALYKLNQQVLFLYDCMRVLGITEEEAIIEDFTLNRSTGEKLRDRAVHSKDTSFHIKQTIILHSW